MRITGGTSRGIQLKVPTSNLVRPTTDRTREAIFSMLAARLQNWSRGLDLFAGTGALGIESLSRGMDWVDFVDQEPRCCAIIKQNLTKAGLIRRAHVYCLSVSKALSVLDGNYDVIFIDPPYKDTILGDLLIQLDGSKLVTSDSLIVISHASRSSLMYQYDTLHQIKSKKHGDTSISIYAR